VGVVLWRDESGRSVATVVAKATYELKKDVSALSHQPEPIREPDDLAPFKGGHEILIVGNRLAHSANARITIGAVEILVATTPPPKRDAVLEREG
jgi:hypothetical protein